MSLLKRAGTFIGKKLGEAARPRGPARIGLALGGGFARGIAHIGVLRVFEQERIPLSFIGGVSAGSIVAASYASGSTPREIEAVARMMRFNDVASWTLSFKGFADSRRMELFLKRSLKQHRFEDMRIPLAVVATCLNEARPVVFQKEGDVLLPIRASCSYPGMFLPIEHGPHVLVDGAMTMELPAKPLKQMGATHVVAVCLPIEKGARQLDHVFQVINRSFQVMQHHMESQWRLHANCVLTPDVAKIGWDGFEHIDDLIEAGEKAARQALPQIRSWLA